MGLLDALSLDPPPTETAVIVGVPAAEAIVERHRRRFDAAARWGVPAHVTIVYPFVNPAAVDDELLERLGNAVGGVPAFNCTFNRTCWFDREVLWLDPEPSDPFKELTRRVVAAFPDHQPYGGVFGDDVRPHLTVGESRLAAGDELARVEADVQAALPFRAAVTEALLIAGTAAPASWGLVAHLPLRKA